MKLKSLMPESVEVETVAICKQCGYNKAIKVGEEIKCPYCTKKEKLTESMDSQNSPIGKEVSIVMYVNAKVVDIKGKIIKVLSNGQYAVKLKNGAIVNREPEEVSFNLDTMMKEVDMLGTKQPIFYPENVDDLSVIDKAIKAPYAYSQLSTLGGQSRASILTRVSLDPKTEWSNGIFQNSRYMHFRLDIDGTAEQFSVSHRIDKKFRKTKVKNIGEFVEKVNKYIEIVK